MSPVDVVGRKSRLTEHVSDSVDVIRHDSNAIQRVGIRDDPVSVAISSMANE